LAVNESLLASGKLGDLKRRFLFLIGALIVFRFVAHVPVPGVDPAELEMTVMGNTLTLAGERKEFDPAGAAFVWHRNERGVGTFQRTIELPGEIDNGTIAATCKNGVLTVTVNKAESAKPKKIAVAVA